MSINGMSCTRALLGLEGSRVIVISSSPLEQAAFALCKSTSVNRSTTETQHCNEFALKLPHMCTPQITSIPLVTVGESLKYGRRGS